MKYVQVLKSKTGGSILMLQIVFTASQMEVSIPARQLGFSLTREKAVPMTPR
jgi:hypothetical protein